MFSSICSVSRSGPGGREEVGEGRRLDGAVGGDMPEEEENWLRGEDVEGREGVDM